MKNMNPKIPKIRTDHLDWWIPMGFRVGILRLKLFMKKYYPKVMAKWD